jgi:hypothetical protein
MSSEIIWLPETGPACATRRHLQEIAVGIACARKRSTDCAELEGHLLHRYLWVMRTRQLPSSMRASCRGVLRDGSSIGGAEVDREAVRYRPPVVWKPTRTRHVVMPGQLLGDALQCSGI